MPKGTGLGNTIALFKKEMARRAAHATTLRRMDEALKAEDNREFLAAFKECADRGIGPAAQSVDLTTGGQPLAPQVWVFGEKRVEF